ncbi:Armadillo-type fold protein [Metarhizium rileyi]|uniref:MMS19 nucleotide excision repair protein n=1 Tax=Metarhizium rileyi (strain RCEF 4871) TaxID=1649241 RepID=A0A167A7F5_METRR|nr:Armadillo-type fold protein [Metarhizium rileyi RCEF 4871]
MADFRQLALDFVLENDTAKSVHTAQKAAKEIETAAPGSNPVARWVESVQPWMPGTSDDDVMRDSDDTPDWTARSKALEFLSRTLDHLSPEALKPSQVNLLVAFFGAMFDVDHKAGILPSATALSRIIAMKSFHPNSGKDIIQKVCTLKEDFPRQVSKTRLAVYELLRSLVGNPEVAKDLKQRDGDDATFMKVLLHLCQSERDPDCLMVWFDILRLFLSGYSPSKETLEEVYGTFKAYFPITLPRTAQSGVTPEQLKLQLRQCFSSSHRLASLSIPFLIGKLDQGDGVTVNVKVDVLRTIRACLEEYQDAGDSITPYANRIWTSLKYEVRNGEIEDTIWATLEVLKALTSRLTGDDLRDYTLTVTRDCVVDLATPMYTTAAGRLLVSVLSANPSAFVLMVAPAITHIKENLRHPKSPTHSQDLLKILRVILETRLLLTNVDMTEQDKNDFAAVDGIFKTLYADVYKGPLELSQKPGASEEDLRLSTEAAQGIGSLVGQKEVQSLAFCSDNSTSELTLLLPVSTCAESCETLFNVCTRKWDERSRRIGADDLVNESAKALQRAIQAFPKGFQPLVAQGSLIFRQSIVNLTHESLDVLQSLGPLLGYIGCSSVSENLALSIRQFVEVMRTIELELSAAIEQKASPRIWCSLVAGIHSTARYFNDACLEKHTKADAVDWTLNLDNIAVKYPQLSSLDPGSEADLSTAQPTLGSVNEARSDALLISLYVARSLYRRATQSTETGGQLAESGDFSGSEPQYELRYLYLLSELAGFIVHELDESQQALLEVEKLALNLFREDKVMVSALSPWNWLTSGRLSILSLGILESVRPSRIAELYGTGVAQQILLEGTAIDDSANEVSLRPVKRSVLAVLANKHNIETLDSVMANIETSLQNALQNSRLDNGNRSLKTNLETCLSIFTLMAGLLRRCSSIKVRPLLQLLRTAPDNPLSGYQLGRGLEIIVAPQKLLTKENFAVVRLLWLQKVYIELAKPMLEAALGNDPNITDTLIRTNFSIAALLMVKHLDFSIYEQDADKILRIAIVIAQNLGVGSDGIAALQVIKNILIEAPEQAQDHIRSLVKICAAIFTERGQSMSRPDWLPAEYGVTAPSLEIQARCGKIALEIVGGLPRMFEHRHLLAYEPQVQRDLSTACGHGVRELRNTARSARGAWADVK